MTDAKKWPLYLCPLENCHFEKFQKRQIPKLEHSKNGIFQQWHIPTMAQS